jgi:hypothetical protein
LDGGSFWPLLFLLPYRDEGHININGYCIKKEMCGVFTIEHGEVITACRGVSILWNKCLENIGYKSRALKNGMSFA